MLVAAVGLVPVDGSKVKLTLGVLTLNAGLFTADVDAQKSVHGVADCGFNPFTNGNKVVTVKGNVGFSNDPR
jgi:hypothetical protein